MMNRFVRCCILFLLLTLTHPLWAEPNQSNSVHFDNDTDLPNYIVKVMAYDSKGNVKSYGTGYILKMNIRGYGEFYAVVSSSHVIQGRKNVKIYFNKREVSLGAYESEKNHILSFIQSALNDYTNNYTNTPTGGIINELVTIANNATDFVVYPLLSLPPNASYLARLDLDGNAKTVTPGYSSLAHLVQNPFLDLDTLINNTTIYLNKDKNVLFHPPPWSQRPLTTVIEDSPLRLKFKGRQVPFEFENPTLNPPVKGIANYYSKDEKKVLYSVRYDSFRYSNHLRKSYNGHFYIVDKKIYPGESGSPVLAPYEFNTYDNSASTLVLGHINSFSPLFDKSHISMLSPEFQSYTSKMIRYFDNPKLRKKTPPQLVTFQNDSLTSPSQGPLVKIFDNSTSTVSKHSPQLYSTNDFHSRSENTVIASEIARISPLKPATLSFSGFGEGLLSAAYGEGLLAGGGEAGDGTGGGESGDGGGGESGDGSQHDDNHSKPINDTEIINNINEHYRLGLWYKDSTEKFKKKTRILAFKIYTKSPYLSQDGSDVYSLRYIPASWINFMYYMGLRKEHIAPPTPFTLDYYKILVQYKLDTTWELKQRGFEPLLIHEHMKCKIQIQSDSVITHIQSDRFHVDFNIETHRLNFDELSDYVSYTDHPDYEVVLSQQGLYSTSTLDFSRDSLVSPFGKISEFDLFSSAPFLQMKVRNKHTGAVELSEPIFCFK